MFFYSLNQPVDNSSLLELLPAIFGDMNILTDSSLVQSEHYDPPFIIDTDLFFGNSTQTHDSFL
jgi:hypothetical protein